MIEAMPLPATDDPIDAPFWKAALRDELVVQRCGQCHNWRFPPRPMCPTCQSFEHTWEAVSGEGRIWSFVVPHPPLLPYFARLVPYNVIVVELAEDPRLRMVGNLVASAAGELNEIDPHQIRIGDRVRVVFWRAEEDVALPRWARA